SLSLPCQCPAAQDRRHYHRLRKSLLCCEPDAGFRARLGSVLFTAELMEHGSNTQGNAQAKGGRHLLCQGQCLLAPCQRLVRIAQYPEDMGVKAAAIHPQVLPIQERRSAVLLGVVEGYPLYEVRMRSGWRSQVEQCIPQGKVRRQKHGSVL